MLDDRGAGGEIRRAAKEIRREGAQAASEVRVELRAAGRETHEALREAMDEMRAALGEVWDPARVDAISGSSGRLSRAERKELTRELLLDAAMDVFAKKGYHGASLDDVAEAAGFTKGAVYSNFTRKSDLFQALLERETTRRNTALSAGIEAVPFEMLPELAGRWLAQNQVAERDWDILTIEFWLAAVRDEGIRETLAQGQRSALDTFGAMIERKVEEAGVDPGFDGRELAVIVNALGSGLLMARYLDPGSETAELFERAVRRLLAPVSQTAAQPADDTDGASA